MKDIYRIILLLFIANQGFSQKYFDNRLTIDYTKQFDGFDGSLFLLAGVLYIFDSDLVSKENYDENCGDNCNDYDDIYTKNKSFIDHTFNLNYKLNRKFSLNLTYNYLKYDFLSDKTVFNYIHDNNGDWTLLTTKYKNNFRINKSGIGVGFNYYLKGSYSPLGTSIGVQYFLNSFIISDNDKFYDFLNRGYNYKKLTESQKNETIKYRTNSLKFNFNFVSMLSSKIPLFYKYGFSFNLPIKSFISDKIYKDSPFEVYPSYLSGAGDNELLKKFKYDYLANLHLGIGYLF